MNIRKVSKVEGMGMDHIAWNMAPREVTSTTPRQCFEAILMLRFSVDSSAERVIGYLNRVLGMYP